ncbi:MAG TPA: DUF6152 family protein [Vicinamibacterales bacterium]|jgi:hypothetical protein|nr:DUF6152 family protein [Vicinamibacterales bacterium]
MKTTLTALSILAGLLAVSSPAFAHHGNAAYDGSVTILKDATVTKLSWANPHTILEFDVKGENGQPVHWAAELGSPSALGLIGWTKTSVSPGDVITVYVHQAKTKNPVGRIDHIVLADGSSLRDSGGGGGNNDVDNAGRGGRGGRRGGGGY